MTDWVPWFSYQLKASGEAFVWAAQQLRPAEHFTLPPEPGYLGTWPAARHIWHVTGYERCLALPAMQGWMDGNAANKEEWHDEDTDWEAASDRSLERLLEEFQVVRQKQLLLLDHLTAVDWTALQKTGWGDKPLTWIVTKTFQHAYEHADTLLRMVLWREHIEALMAAGQVAASK